MKKEIHVVTMGLGYIGLPTAALIASKRIQVLGVDIDTEVVDIINRGQIHIIEPDLAGLVKDVVENGYLRAAPEPSEADVFLIAVPTPFLENHEPDVSYIESAIEMIIPFLKEGNLIIIESTIPVGTTEKMAEIVYSSRPDLRYKIYLAYCPERVLPGHVIYELEHNDRVIGGIDDGSTEMAVEFYSLFVRGNLHGAEVKTAEMCKLVENAYRDVNIAFANELSIISHKAGIDIFELVKLANRHPRVNILQPGSGVGGHCIAVDPWFIVSDFKEDSRLIQTAREVNVHKTNWVLSRVREVISQLEMKNRRKAVIACMGLSYKADIDDLRESPSLYVTETLLSEGYRVLPVEPNLDRFDGFKLFDCEEAVKAADIIVFLVNHRLFRGLEIGKGKRILDFCGWTHGQ